MVAGRALCTPHAAACVPRVRVRAAHVFAPRADVRAPRAHSSAISCARSWNVRMVVVRARGCGSCVVSRVLMASVARWCSRPAQMFAPRAHIRRQFRARGRGTCAGWWNVRVVVVRARWMRVLVAGVWRVRVRVTRGFSSAFSVRGVSRVLMAGVARWCLRAAQVFVAARVFASRACFRRLFRARGRGTCAGWWNVRVVVVRARGRVSWDLVCGAYLFVRRARFRRPFCARGGGTCAGWWFGRGVAGPGCAACVFV